MNCQNYHNETFYAPIIIYFIGVVLSLILGRYVFRMVCNKNEFNYDWGYVILNVGISIVSWIGFVSLFFVFLLERDWKVSKKTGKPKTPPRWL